MKKIKGIYYGGLHESKVLDTKEYCLPSFELNDNDVPEIRDFKIGEKITIKLEVTPKRISKREETEEKDNSITTCELEIQGVEVEKKRTLNEKVESREAKDPNRM